MAQRLVRAKRKIRDAGIPYVVPETNDMAARIDAVLTVIYLVFNEGYAATRVGPLVRTDLCAEAIRLGRLVRSLMLPQPPAEATALLALMLFMTHAAKPVSMKPAILSFSKSRTALAGIKNRSPRLCRWSRKRFAAEPGPFALQAAHRGCALPGGASRGYGLARRLCASMICLSVCSRLRLSR